MSFLYARRSGGKATAILPMDKKDALRVMKANRGIDFQLGVLGGADLETVTRVYGEFAPYRRVKTIEELFEQVDYKG
ncbi:hypothetical protein SLU01_33800 [Sporosarcina luteola]|uniref:Uncharacterized protein n=1 Tax=Sporosarcina luteola TaxID=582850 RepID=A0A511ZC96_9BACL|nr:hypothetical protein [Sporosarcina luteola]GEN85068.1 hypothetical protein SLU01_33800 [Sporosarcina luteola]